MQIPRAGLSKYGARLEGLLRGPTHWRVQESFEEGQQVIIVEIMSDVKKQGPKRAMPS